MKLLLILIVLLTGCGGNKFLQNSSKENSAVIQTGLSPLKKSDSLITVNAKDSNGIRILRRWEFERYEPEKNKIIGFWPECCGNKKFAYLKEYRNIWGFNAVVVTAQEKSIKMALRSGFELNNIFTTVHQFKTVSKIKEVVNTVNSKLYYIDEPLERGDYSPEDLIEIANYISNKRPDAKLILGSYQKTWWLYKFFPPQTYASAYNEVLKNTSNVQIMCDQYSGDQIPEWESFYETYGTDKVYGQFIHSKIDSAEYSTLLDTTNIKSKTKRIFYFHGASGSPDKTPEFCQAAWQQGWLKKIEREFVYYLKCKEKKNNCDKPNAKWEVVKTVKTNNLRTAKHRKALLK